MAIAPQYVSVRDVAVMFGVTRGTVHRWLAAHELPCVKIGHTIRIPWPAVNDLMVKGSR